MAKGKYERTAAPRKKERPKTEPEQTPKKRKGFTAVLNVLKNLLVGLVVLAAVAMLIFTIFSMTMFDRTERSLFGYQAFVVLSDSMSATDFEAGDVVLVKQVDPATLRVGDIIAYTSRNEHNYGDTVTHKIRSLTTDEYGNPGFITYGTTTDTDDEAVVTYSYVLGKYQTRLPKVGLFFQFVKTGPGYILCILIPFGLLIAWQGVNSVRLFRQDKKEEMAKLQAEREQIEAERAETRQMLAELKKMQEQMLRNSERRE